METIIESRSVIQPPMDENISTSFWALLLFILPFASLRFIN